MLPDLRAFFMRLIFLVQILESSKSTVYDHFTQWQKSGLFAKILEELGEEADLEDMSLDSTSVDAHQHSAGAKKGR